MVGRDPERWRLDAYGNPVAKVRLKLLKIIKKKF